MFCFGDLIDCDSPVLHLSITQLIRAPSSLLILIALFVLQIQPSVCIVVCCFLDSFFEFVASGDSSSLLSFFRLNDGRRVLSESR